MKNPLGPGRAGSLQVSDQPGSQIDGALTDNGDGSYTQCVIWDPDSERPPGISIEQPGRPPVDLVDPTRKFYRYSVKFLCGTELDKPCCEPAVRPGTYATEINIHNPHNRVVRIRRYVLPLVFAGAVVGREPRFSQRRAADAIVLPPRSATMDDCCRIGELLLSAPPASALPLTIGILDIVSTQELAITAVYTVTSASGTVDLDAVRIPLLGRSDGIVPVSPPTPREH